MGLFKDTPNSFLGIDIGTSGIKIIELKKDGDQAKLLSYGFSENYDVMKAGSWHEDPKKTADLIVKTLEKAQMSSRQAVASLPAYSVFSSIINLVNIDKKNIDQAVEWETKKVIPVPIEDVVLEWRLIESRLENNREYLKIFVIAAPRVLVKKYQEIFKEAKISLINLESETFSLIRSLLGKDKSTIMLVELGSTTTNISVIERGIPFLNRSIDMGGKTITNTLTNKLKISLEEAEQFKYDMGITALESKDSQVPQIITESIEPLVNEIKYLIGLYQGRGEKRVEKIILTGGSSLLINLPNYLTKILDVTTVVGDCWSRVSYPLELKPLLQEIGPRLSIATGLALDRLE